MQLISALFFASAASAWDGWDPTSVYSDITWAGGQVTSAVAQATACATAANSLASEVSAHAPTPPPGPLGDWFMNDPDHHHSYRDACDWATLVPASLSSSYSSYTSSARSWYSKFSTDVNAVASTCAGGSYSPVTIAPWAFCTTDAAVVGSGNGNSVPTASVTGGAPGSSSPVAKSASSAAAPAAGSVDTRLATSLVAFAALVGAVAIVL